MVRMIADANASLDALLRSGTTELRLITNYPQADGTDDPTPLAVGNGYTHRALDHTIISLAANGEAVNNETGGEILWTSTAAWPSPVTGIAYYDTVNNRYTDFQAFSGQPRNITASNEALIIDRGSLSTRAS